MNDREARRAATDDPPATDHALLLMPKRAGHHGDLIDMTAMVDIVFFLLIFFLVTSMESLQSVLALPAPQGPATAAAPVTPDDFTEDSGYVTVTIYEDDSVWIEDEQTFGEQDLRSQLRSLRRGNNLLTGVFVECSPDANHGAFVGVLDAAADAGFVELKFSVTADDGSTSLGSL